MSRSGILLLAAKCPEIPWFLGFLGGSVVKNLPANTGDTGSNPSGEDTLEEEMETHSRILAWEIPWTEAPRGLHTVHGVTKSQT